MSCLSTAKLFSFCSIYSCAAPSGMCMRVVFKCPIGCMYVRVKLVPILSSHLAVIPVSFTNELHLS